MCLAGRSEGGWRTELAPYLALWHTRSPTVRTHSVWRHLVKSASARRWERTLTFLNGIEKWQCSWGFSKNNKLFLPSCSPWLNLWGLSLKWLVLPPTTPAPRSPSPYPHPTPTPAWSSWGISQERGGGRWGGGLLCFQLERSNQRLEIFAKPVKQQETVSVVSWSGGRLIVWCIWGPFGDQCYLMCWLLIWRSEWIVS